ncbi:hypothetical protein D3C74_506470 [compost metagenome]
MNVCTYRSRFIISMLNQDSSAPQAPRVWPRKLFCELIGMCSPNRLLVARVSAMSPCSVAVP